MRSILFIFVLIIQGFVSHAQDLTGTWETVMDDRREFLQLNIVKGKDKLCGYTWDYQLGNKESYCKAFFEATFDKENKQWVFVGKKMIETSGGHELMILRLCFLKENNIAYLEGTLGVQTITMWSSKESFIEEIKLKRVYPKPAYMYRFMEDCIAEAKKKPVKKSTVFPPAPKKPLVKSPTRPKPVEMPPPQKDTAAFKRINPEAPVINNRQPPPVSTIQEKTVQKKMLQRKRTEVSRIKINTRDIILNVYDNGVVDNDTVSIFYNGKLIANHQWLSEKSITIPLHLDENTNIHEITMFADNLGGIPPNTALIVVTTKDKRYELRSSASLDTNAVLVFEYVPDN